MTITLNGPCIRCRNAFKREKGKSYGSPRCKAFPSGIPYEYLFEKDVMELEECNNGFKFEENEDMLI
jgi:hypothetical protein